MVTNGKRDGGLYVLECGNSAILSFLKNESLHGFYDLWHAHLEHVNHSVISYLNKQGYLYLTSLLPSSTYCSICQLAKNHHLPYPRNDHRLSHLFDLIHCDI